MSKLPVQEIPFDFSPMELTDTVALENLDERLPVIVENLSRTDSTVNRKRLEYNLTQQIKSLAYLLQDLLLTSKKERAAGAMDSVTATLGEVGKTLYTELTGETLDDEPDGKNGSNKKSNRSSAG